MVRNRSIRGLSAGRRPLFVSGCCPVYRRLFVAVNPFVQKMSGKITPHRITSHHITSQTTSHHITTPHHITSHHTTSHHIAPKHVICGRTTLHHSIPYHTTHITPVVSKTLTYHGRVGAGRCTAGRRGRAGLTGRCAQELPVLDALQTIEDNPPGRLSGSTNKRTPMQTDGGTKPAVDQRLTSG